MSLELKKEFSKNAQINDLKSKNKDAILLRDYIEFLNEAGWRLEKKLPSNRNNYSVLLEDTEWASNAKTLKSSKHFRRDLDALS